jgi:hypothetical protein
MSAFGFWTLLIGVGVNIAAQYCNVPEWAKKILGRLGVLLIAVGILGILIPFLGLHLRSPIVRDSTREPLPAPTEAHRLTDGKHWYRILPADKWNTAAAIRGLGWKDKPFSIVGYDNPECENLKQDLQDIFLAAGWKPTNEPMLGTALPKGVSIHASQSSESIALQNILTENLGYSVKRDDPPRKEGSVIDIVVGNPPDS